MGKWSLAAAIVALVVVVLICYIYFIYRWDRQRLASICASKFSMLDLIGAKRVDSYGEGVAFAHVEASSINVSDDKTTINCVVEIRNKETQTPLEKISTYYKIANSANGCSPVDACVVV